jgi:hypothetical protein
LSEDDVVQEHQKAGHGIRSLRPGARIPEGCGTQLLDIQIVYVHSFDGLELFLM